MSKPIGVGTSAAALILSLLASAASAATTYHITDLGQGIATGLNDLGQVVGHDGSVGFLIGAGGTERQVLSPLAGFNAVQPMAINNAGQIVGALSAGDVTSGITQSVFMYSPGDAAGMKALGTLGGNKVYSLDIGEGGHVVGLSSDANGLRHVLFKRPGSDALQNVSPHPDAPDYVLDTIKQPKVNASGQITMSYHYYYESFGYVSGPDGGTLTKLVNTDRFYDDLLVTDINDQGRMAGFLCGDYSGCRGTFVNADGSLTAIADPFERVSVGRLGLSGSLAISETNNASQVAGIYSGYNQATQAFLSQADGKGLVAVESLTFDNPELLAQIQTVAGLRYPGVTFPSVGGLNNVGQLLLNGGDGRMYLLSPVPEPATVLSMLTGLAMVAGLAAHRRRRTH